jgi:hypothetical protein
VSGSEAHRRNNKPSREYLTRRESLEDAVMAPPRFLNICSKLRGFNIRSKASNLRQKPYPGMVVVSQKCFYFAVDMEAVRRSRKMTYHQLLGPLLGEVVGGKVHSKKKKRTLSLLSQPDPEAEQVELADLPAEVREDPDWPVPWEEGPVLVVPRRAVLSVRTSFMLGGIEVELTDVRILAFTPIFQRKRLAESVEEYGWEVEGL